MLIRFIVDNVFSFGERKEFNMLPMPRLRRLNHHRYDMGEFDVLRMSAIYGANGAGKSNLIKSLAMLRGIVVNESVTSEYIYTKFKFNKDNDIQTLAVEFIQDDKNFVYGLELKGNIIKTEELYFLDGKKNEELIFERETNLESEKITTKIPELEKDDEGLTLKKVIEKNLCKPTKTIFKLLTTFEEKKLKNVETALKWFTETIEIVTPSAKPRALAHKIDSDSKFKKYTRDTMESFNLGVVDILCKKIPFDDFFGKDKKEERLKIQESLDESESGMISLRSYNGHELIVTQENEEDIFIKELQIEHKGKDEQTELFNLEEESDGTVRLLDLIPAFQDIVQENRVFFIDEIERSIHPLLIKEIVSKFSKDESSQGQLIFTTHESNLLDQEIFRQDEIWFSEKNKEGCTDLYSLSDFKEHNTIDIRKGYLSGRYGSIPFLANFKDINW